MPHSHRNALPPGTQLGEYMLVSARAEGCGESDELGSGGFAIVYLARHRSKRDWLFAIKEYFPREAVRDREDGESVWPATAGAESAMAEGMARFRREADQLHRLRHERNVVSCVNYFEANGTAYLVMNYDDGVPLSRYLKARESDDRPFDEEDLLAVALPLLKGLSAVHRLDVLHRDIKPENVFVRREDDAAGHPAEPVLMDFGAAKQDYLVRDNKSEAPYTPGYAAWEQLSKAKKLSPATDLYGVGALLWRMVAGGAGNHPGLMRAGDSVGAAGDAAASSPEPPDVLTRLDARHSGRPDPMLSARELGKGRFSESVLRAIDSCLAIEATDRPQNCDEVVASLLGTEGPLAPKPPWWRRATWRDLLFTSGGCLIPVLLVLIVGVVIALTTLVPHPESTPRLDSVPHPDSHRVEADATQVHHLVFVGGEPAEVLVRGDGGTDLDLVVYDAEGEPFCASTDLEDTELCSWTPLTTGSFRVEIHNLGRVYNDYLLLTNGREVPRRTQARMRYVDGRVEAEAMQVHDLVFVGGERAEVVVEGDGDTDLDLHVYDAEAEPVCVSDGLEDTERCSWTPLATGVFWVEIHNLGHVYNDYLLQTNGEDP